MTGKIGSTTLQAGSGSLVDGLARSVISKVSATPHQRRFRRVEIGSKVLYAAVMDRSGFHHEQVVADLSALCISPADIVDHCIPQVANTLGADWVADRLDFASVTVASARLFGLCKTVGQNWDNIRSGLNARSLLLTTMERESHILGPAVLSDQLRRRGHSVLLHSNANPQSLREKVSQEQFDGILFSISTWQALESAVQAIRAIRTVASSAVIIVGGTILNEETFDAAVAGADMTTNDIDAALDVMTGEDIRLRVAE
ncbi:MAG: cobalamin B12-binding domain-containing protein [Pseudomonadota bacterium]